MADITRTCGLYYPSDSSYQRVEGVQLFDEEGYLSVYWDELYPFPHPGNPDPPEASSVEILVVKQSDYSRVAFETVDYDYPSETGFYDIALSATGEYYVFMRLYFSNKETFGPWTMFYFTYSEGDVGVDMLLKEDEDILLFEDGRKIALEA